MSKRDSKIVNGSIVTEVFKRRIENNRDGQAIITSRGSERGLGKTTLAIRMAREIYPDFKADKHAFLNIHDYLGAYKKAEPGTVLILDEAEHGADSRRAMSSENVDLSQAWATLRYKNVITIVTLPDTGMLDKRLLRLADFRVNVLKRGVALPMNIQVNDWTGKVRQMPIKRGGDEPELIYFSDLDGDPDFNHLTGKKDRTVTGELERYTPEEVEKRVSKTEKEVRKNTRDEIVAQIYENTDLTQQQIADSIEGTSQPTVARAVRELSG